MKILFVILIIVVSGHARVLDLSRQNQRLLNGDAIIHQLFEMLKYYIKNGDEVKYLPILDPLKFEYGDVEISLPSKLLSLEAGFKDGIITGLGDHQLDKANFIKDEVAVNLTIKFPSIIIKSDYYKMDGDIYEAVPIAGEGKFELEIKNFIFKGKVFLKQSENEKSILIDKVLNPEFNIQQITSNTEIDGTIDDIFNTLIEDLLARCLTKFNKYFAKTYITYIISYVNPYLNNFESWRLLAAVL